MPDADLRFRLLQAREPDEVIGPEEHAAFVARLGCRPEQVVAFDLLHDTIELDTVTDGVDAVLVGGSGRFGVNSEVPWMQPFIDVMGALADQQFPTFASCFGFQALIMAMGTPVQPDPDRSEVGTFPVQLTPDGLADPVFGGIPGTFEAQFGHKDSAAALPEGAVHLARSERCPVQAIRVGARVYATQFHPELRMPDNRLRYERYLALYGGADVRFMPSDEVCALLPRFVDHVLTPR